MKELVLSIFGSYTPVTTVEYVLLEGVYEPVEVIVSGAAGIDWPWIIGALLFAIVLYSFFRMVGVLLK
jgi:hypothetical protein